MENLCVKSCQTRPLRVQQTQDRPRNWTVFIGLPGHSFLDLLVRHYWNPWSTSLEYALTSSSYGEGLETGREIPRQSFTRQIAFKRLKGLLHIDELRAFDPDLAQTYLLAKLLGAVLVDAIRTQGPDFSPYGFPVQSDIPRRVAYFPNDLAGSPHDRSGVCGADRLVSDLPHLD